MKKPLLPVAAFCALTMTPGMLAFAQSAQAGFAPSQTISLDGQVVMRITSAGGGYTAAQRATAIKHRLIPILSIHHLKASAVTVQRVSRRQSNILVDGHLLVTVDPSLARADGETPSQLAQAWAANLRRTLPAASVGDGGKNHQGLL